MKKYIITTATALVASMTITFAQSGTDKDQTTMNIDSYEEFQKVDKELNIVYQKVVKATDDAKQLSKLKAAQNNWIKFRDSDCNFVASVYEGGSMQPLVANKCMIDRTKSRIKELKEMLEN